MEKTIVPNSFQSWPKIKLLIPDHKFIARELWCNPFVSACGVYSIDIDMFAVALGFQTQNVERAIDDFVKLGLIEFDKDTSEILICDWWRFHKCAGTIQIHIIQKSVDKIQSDRLKTSFFERIKHVSNKINDLRANSNSTSTLSLTKTTTTTEEQILEPQEKLDDDVLKFPKILDVRLIPDVTLLLKKIPNAQEFLHELGAGLERKTIVNEIPWLKAVIKNGLYRTAAGFKKEDLIYSTDEATSTSNENIIEPEIKSQKNETDLDDFSLLGEDAQQELIFAYEMTPEFLSAIKPNVKGKKFTLESPLVSRSFTKFLQENQTMAKSHNL
ncbi:MAG: hypothetical protein ABL920_00020 [Methylotenera sp.]|nr:hypothetical protein [Methylotenera sp.]